MTDIRTASTVAILASTALAACSAPYLDGRSSRGAVVAEPAFVRLTEERAFGEALRQRYLELATNAYDRGDFDRSDFYSMRALMAVEGKLALPAPPVGATGEIDAAHQRLASAMSGPVRTGNPQMAARAQAAYDCWLLEAGEGGNPQIASACRHNAFQALAALETPGGTRVAQAPGQTRSYSFEAGAAPRRVDAGGMTIEVLSSAPPQPASVGMPAVPAPAPMVQAMPVQGEPIRMAALEPSYETVALEAAPVVAAPMPVAPMAAAPAPLPMIEPVAAPPFAPLAPAPTPAPYAVEAIDGIPMIDVAEASVTYESAPSDFGGLPVIDEETANALLGMNQPMTEGTVFAVEPMAPPEVALLDPTMIPDAAPVAADSSVYFGFDSAEITPEAEDVLIDVIERLRLGDAGTVTLTGFADPEGDARYNQLLAMRRVQAVRRYVEEAAGRPLSFELRPVGEANGAAANDDVAAAFARRVEVSLR